jgi:nucleoside 2-deoxyribosyltransferase
MVTIYLAGAIRDTHPEDWEWREDFISRYAGEGIRILNPLGAKTFNPLTKEWKMSGIKAAAKEITKQDLWCVKRSDIVIANLLALAEGYPNIGTLMEFGAAIDQQKLIYTIIPGGYSGHANPGNFKLHPVIDQFSAAVFNDLEAFYSFFDSHISMLTGEQPSWGGLVNGTTD